MPERYRGQTVDPATILVWFSGWSPRVAANALVWPVTRKVWTGRVDPQVEVYQALQDIYPGTAGVIRFR